MDAMFLVAALKRIALSWVLDFGAGMPLPLRPANEDGPAISDTEDVGPSSPAASSTTWETCWVPRMDIPKAEQRGNALCARPHFLMALRASSVVRSFSMAQNLVHAMRQ